MWVVDWMLFTSSIRSEILDVGGQLEGNSQKKLLERGGDMYAKRRERIDSKSGL